MKKEEQEASRTATSALAGDGERSKPRKKGKVIGMNIRHAKDHTGKRKGYTAHHVHEHPEMPDMEQVDKVPHNIADMEQLHDHVDKFMGQGGGEGEGEAGPQAEGGGSQE